MLNEVTSIAEEVYMIYIYIIFSQQRNKKATLNEAMAMGE